MTRGSLLILVRDGLRAARLCEEKMRELARAALLLAPAVHAQFQFEIPPDMFGQMGGGGHFGGQWAASASARRRRRRVGARRHHERVRLAQGHRVGLEQLAQHPLRPGRHVRRADARLPAARQARVQVVDDQTVYIQWGEAGLHKVKPTAMEPKEGTHLRGTRVKDREKCDAAFVRKEERDEDIDMYEVLGISDEATSAEVKKAYRRLSLKYHPDKCAGNVMNEKKGEEEPCDVAMNRVNLAYETLGDEDSRILYDTGGLEAVKEMKAEDERGGGGGGMDPFSMLFGGGGGGGGARGRNSSAAPARRARRGAEDMSTATTSRRRLRRSVPRLLGEDRRQRDLRALPEQDARCAPDGQHDRAAGGGASKEKCKRRRRSRRRSARHDGARRSSSRACGAEPGPDPARRDGAQAEEDLQFSATVTTCTWT